MNDNTMHLVSMNCPPTDGQCIDIEVSQDTAVELQDIINDHGAGDTSEIPHTFIADNASSELDPFCCETCGRYFRHADSLKRHMYCTHAEKTHTCQTCGKKFRLTWSLTKHTRLHTGQNLHTCQTCGKSFTLACLLKSHRRIHTGERPYTCSSCGKSFALSTALHAHSRKHTNERPYACLMCGMRFTQNSILRAHLRIHTKEKPYTCQKCDARFAQLGALNRHSCTGANRSDIRKFKCSVCGKNYGSAGTLAAHRRLHFRTRQYICDLCGRMLSSMTSLQLHVHGHFNENQLVGSRQLSTNSPDCDLTGNDSRVDIADTELQQQSTAIPLPTENTDVNGDGISTMDTNTTQHRCVDCRGYFVSAVHLQKHVRNMHAKLKKYICKTCGASFTFSESLKRHIRQHTGETPFQCDKCGLAFTFRSALNEHLRRHEGVKQYRCGLCAKEFSFLHRLRSHLFIVHGCEVLRMPVNRARATKPSSVVGGMPSPDDATSDVEEDLLSVNADIAKPHKCVHCGGLFATAYHLQKHMKSHGYPTPHCCTVCGKGFRAMSLLMRHQRLHNTNNLCETTYHTDAADICIDEPLKHYRCQQCENWFSDRPALLSHTHQQQNAVCDVSTVRNYSGLASGDAGNFLLSSNDRARHGKTKNELSRFTCDICGRIFTSRQNLKNHLQSHSGVKPHRCTLCDKSFSRPNVLKHHMLQVHRVEKPYTCQLCGEAFELLRQLKRHVRAHIRNGEILPADGESMPLVDSPSESESNVDPKRRDCQHCGKRFQSARDLRRHMRSHTGERPHRCQFCDKGFVVSHSLRLHLKFHCQKLIRLKHLEDTDLQTIVDKTGLSEDRATALSVSSSKNRKSHKCNLCGLFFKTSCDLDKHTLNVHADLDETPMEHFCRRKCPNCDRCFSSNGTLRRHVSSCVGKPVEPENSTENLKNAKEHNCKYCGKTMRSAYHLLKHVNLVHVLRKPHRCLFCGKSFKTISGLARHGRYHVDEKPYRCQNCGKYFVTSGMLLCHMKAHSDSPKKRLFKCPQCDKCCLRAHHLQRHMAVHEQLSEIQNTDIIETQEKVENIKKPHSCNLCGQCFSQHKALQQHIRVHLKGNVYSCKVCEKLFSSQFVLTRHLQSHAKSKSHQANEENEQPTTTLQLLVNKVSDAINLLKTETDDESQATKQHECQDCGKSFVSAEHVRDHWQQMHGHVDSRHRCPYCSRSFSQRGTLKRHMMRHTGQKPFRCELCDAAFDRRYTLTCHLRTHTGEKPYSCQLCSKTFAQLFGLRSHVCSRGFQQLQTDDLLVIQQQHTTVSAVSRDIVEDNSSDTDTASEQEQDLNGHEQKSNDPDVEPVPDDQTMLHTCHYCGKGFTSLDCLIQHISSHTELTITYECPYSEQDSATNERLYQCGEKTHTCMHCDECFGELRELQKHMQFHLETDTFQEVDHSNVKPSYACSECDRIFSSKTTLACHLRLHSGAKLYQCEKCGKTFVYASALSSHMRVHERMREETARTPKQCKQCGKYCANAKALRKHVTIHSGVKPHRCEVCGKQFRLQEYLWAHRRLHTGKMPFRCVVCGKAFQRQAQLILHARNHTLDNSVIQSPDLQISLPPISTAVPHVL